MRTVVFAALWVLPFAAQTLSAQDAPKPAAAPSPYQSVVGTVESEDLAKKTFSVKPDKADATTVKFDDRTSFVRIPAGETDVNKGTKVAAGDVSVGDRILARVWADNPTGKPAIRFVITKQADLAQRQQKTLADWQTQSVVGIVSAVDNSAKTATMKVRAGNAPVKDVTVDLSGKVNYENFSAETGQYQTANGSDIAVGDQLRVLGTKNADVTNIKADAVQYAAFKSIPAQIKSVDAAAMLISAIDPSTKKPVTISVKAFTSMKRLDDQSALMLARRLNPNFQAAGAGGRGGRGGGAPGGAGPGGPPAGAGGPQAGGPPAGGPPAGAAGGRGGFGGGGGRGMDPARIIEQQQTIQIADLKPGEPLIISGVVSPDGSKITATTLIAGVDPILRASPNNGADPLGGGWNFGGDGGGGGGGAQ